MQYSSELQKAMALLAAVPESIFVGQAVRCTGQVAFQTFYDVPLAKRIEMPVAEDFQVGFCTGLALTGYLPLCFFPRWDFALLAANQIVNHLDKADYLGWRAKVIIRTAIGRREPYDQGPQHRQNYSGAFRFMCSTIVVEELSHAEGIVAAYNRALHREESSIIVERMELYDDAT